MKRQKMRIGISFLLTVVMLFSFSGQYRPTAENSMPVEEPKTYSEVTDNSRKSSISDQCSILNYVDEKEFMSNGFTKRVATEEDLNTYIFEREDGTRGLYMFSEDVKFEDAAGIIVEKDISLEKTSGGYSTKQNNVGLFISDSLSKGVELSFGEEKLTISVPKKDNVVSKKSDNSVKYINAYGENAHIVFTPTLSGVKQDIVLDNHIGVNSFDITVSSESLKPFYDKEGGLYFAEAVLDDFRFNVGSVFIYDSSGHFTGGDIKINQIAKDKWIMTLIVPKEFLSADSTVYPVTIDPKIEIKASDFASYIEETSVYSGKPNLAAGTWTYNNTGFQSDGYNISRMLVRTPGLYNNTTFNSIYASEISYAKFCIKEASGTPAQEVKLYAYTGTPWSENTATWNNTSPNGNYTLIDTQYPVNGAVAEYDVTNLVKGWKNGTYSASLGFMLRSTDESNVSNKKTYYTSESSYTNVQPYIIVYYQTQLFLFSYAVDLNEGESFSNLAITNPTTTVLWTSSDPTVATVNSAGVITGVRASATPVTITATVLDPYGPSVSKTCTVYVKIPDGTYFLKNKSSGRYADSSGNSIGNEVLRWHFHGASNQRWDIEYISNGLYSIKNNMSNLYLGVEALNSTTAITRQYSTLNNSTKWYIAKTTSGAYCFYAAGNLAIGYVIGADPNSNNTIVNMVYTNNSDYKDEWITELDLISISSRLPNGNAQNKTMWCWAACSKMVGEHNGGDGALSKVPKTLSFSNNVHSYGGILFYGETLSGEITVDGGQKEIVVEVHGDDDNHPGDNANKEQAIRHASYSAMNIGTIGAGSLSSSNIDAMNSELSAGRWVIANVFTNVGWSGHSIVLQTYDSSTQTYWFWDPWTDSCGSFTKTQLLNNTIHLVSSSTDRTLAWIQYCR